LNPEAGRQEGRKEDVEFGSRRESVDSYVEGLESTGSFFTPSVRRHSLLQLQKERINQKRAERNNKQNCDKRFTRLHKFNPFPGGDTNTRTKKAKIKNPKERQRARKRREEKGQGKG